MTKNSQKRKSLCTKIHRVHIGQSAFHCGRRHCLLTNLLLHLTMTLQMAGEWNITFQQYILEDMLFVMTESRGGVGLGVEGLKRMTPNVSRSLIKIYVAPQLDTLQDWSFPISISPSPSPPSHMLLIIIRLTSPVYEVWSLQDGWVLISREAWWGKQGCYLGLGGIPRVNTTPFVAVCQISAPAETNPQQLLSRWSGSKTCLF